MKTRYHLIRRGIRGGGFYCVDNKTGKRTRQRGGGTSDCRSQEPGPTPTGAEPSNPQGLSRPHRQRRHHAHWRDAIGALCNSKQGANQHRWKTAAKDKALSPLLPQVIIAAQSVTLLRVLRMGYCFHECLSAATPQFLRGHELAALAAGAQTPMASRAVQRQKGGYLGGTLSDRGAGAKS